MSFTQVAYIASYTVVTGDNNDVLDITNRPVKIDGVDDATTVTLEVVEGTTSGTYFVTTKSALFQPTTKITSV